MDALDALIDLMAFWVLADQHCQEQARINDGWINGKNNGNDMTLTGHGSTGQHQEKRDRKHDRT